MGPVVTVGGDAEQLPCFVDFSIRSSRAGNSPLSYNSTEASVFAGCKFVTGCDAGEQLTRGVRPLTQSPWSQPSWFTTSG